MEQLNNECCATCKHKYRLEKLDYSQGGCIHTPLDGYICMAFERERLAEWMVGDDPENEMCEMYEPYRPVIRRIDNGTAKAD